VRSILILSVKNTGGLVDILSDLLGPEEDFDGLVTDLEDAMDSGEYDDLI